MEPDLDSFFASNEFTGTVATPKHPVRKAKRARTASSDDAGDDEAGLNKQSEEDEKLPRTVFVGNLPTTVTKKTLVKHFRSVGPVDSVRFRSVPVASLSVPRRVSAIKRDFKGNTFNAYVVFKSEQDAVQALALNGQDLEGRHIRVDSASGDGKLDTDTSVFVGNLPLDVEEEELITAFSACGHVANVRVVRDKQTQMGKGFGFVEFETMEGQVEASASDDIEIRGRTVRVQPWSNTPQKGSKAVRGRGRGRGGVRGTRGGGRGRGGGGRGRGFRGRGGGRGGRGRGAISVFAADAKHKPRKKSKK